MTLKLFLPTQIVRNHFQEDFQQPSPLHLTDERIKLKIHIPDSFHTEQQASSDTQQQQQQ